MLIQFSFKNFRSFRDDTTIDLSATRMTEFNNRVVEVGNERLLPVAAIFGANASGKSNVQLAFAYMRDYVVHSFAYGGENNQFLKPTPFLFDHKSKDDESVFEVYFIGDANDKFKTYHYGFSIDSLGVKEEWLNTKAKTSRGLFKTIFYRNREEGVIDLKGLSKKYQDNILTSLEKETLIISLGSKLKVPELKMIRDWFMKHQIINNETLINTPLKYLLNDIKDNKINKKDLIHYLSSFDDSIVDIIYKKTKDDYGHEQIELETVHQMIRTKDLITMPLKEESAGTIKMLSMYPLLHSVMKTGGVLFIDELNSRLHPLLVRNFLINFLNPRMNRRHAQIIFTTHDSWTLSNQLLRRDEIWFTEKDMNGVSSLFSLADFNDDEGTKIRKDENYEKNYLLGKYGAIPELRTMMIMEDEAEYDEGE